MSRIYAPTVTEGWEWALPVDANQNLTIAESFGRPLGDTWKPIRMELVTEDESGKRSKKADMPWLGSHLLVLKAKAVLALRDLCLRSGELLPLSCDETELMAWNVTTTVDALDENRSTIQRFKSGEIMRIKRCVFKSDAVARLVAFRIPGVQTRIFVGSEFVRRVDEANLTGTRFEELWTDEA